MLLLFRYAFTHRLLSSSFLGLPHRILNMSHKKGTTWNLTIPRSHRRLCHTTTGNAGFPPAQIGGHGRPRNNGTPAALAAKPLPPLSLPQQAGGGNTGRAPRRGTVGVALSLRSPDRGQRSPAERRGLGSLTAGPGPQSDEPLNPINPTNP